MQMPSNVFHLWFEHNIAYSLQQQLRIQWNNEIGTHWGSWVWKIMKQYILIMKQYI